MTREDAALIVAVHRLAAGDRRACARVARLLSIGGVEAGVIVGMAGGARVTRRSLQGDLDLSPGGAAALEELLVRERLVRGEPDPDCPRDVLLRLSEEAQAEVEAALVPVADELRRIAAGLSPAEREAIATCLAPPRR
jgi:DNA-binding MarR family transcriptional regulator